MQINNDEITVLSKSLEKITSLENAQIAINEDYIEIYSDDKEIYIDNDGNIKQKEELNVGIEALGKYYKSYKENSEIYYSDKAVTEEHEDGVAE